MASGAIYVNKYSQLRSSTILISIGCYPAFAKFKSLRHPYDISSQPLTNF